MKAGFYPAMNFAPLVFLTLLGILTPLMTLAYGRTPAPGWTQTETAGVSYWMYRPSSSADAAASSLMLNLHGCNQTADILKDLGNWEAAAEKHRMTVVIPFVPRGGVVLGCWDYFGRDHTEYNKYNGPLIDLTVQLLQDANLAIDPERVFVSGLSSGAAQAMLLGCLRPDLFRGIGFASGPVIGSEIREVYRPKITAEEAAQVCRSLAGTRTAEFRRQRFSMIFDPNDPTVSSTHAEVVLKAMTELYGGNMREVPIDLSRCEGPNKRGSGTLFVDADNRPRISQIQNIGLGHAWASGDLNRKTGGWPQSIYVPIPPGLPKKSYVNSNSLNFPMILAHFMHR